MANSIWQATVQNGAGDIISGAEITVVDEDTGLPATIFSTIGGAVLTNPFFADSEGFAQFYTGSGTYRVTAEDTGTGQSITWRYIRFGNSGSRDVGTSSGSIPDADDLNMVGAAENYTSNNLNPNVFGGSFGFFARGSGESTTEVRFELPISMQSDPSSITVAGTFSIYNSSWGLVGTGLTAIVLIGSSTSKMALLQVTGTGFIAGDEYKFLAETASSKITVNP